MDAGMNGWARLGIVIYGVYAVCIVGVFVGQLSEKFGDLPTLAYLDYKIVKSIPIPENEALVDKCIKRVDSRNIGLALNCARKHPPERHEYKITKRAHGGNLTLFLFVYPLLLIFAVASLVAVVKWVREGFR